jgi:hypothetical protein
MHKGAYLHGRTRTKGGRRASGCSARRGRRDAGGRSTLPRVAAESTVQPGAAGGVARCSGDRVRPCGRARRDAQRRARRGAVRLRSQPGLPRVRGPDGQRRVAGGAQNHAGRACSRVHVRGDALAALSSELHRRVAKRARTRGRPPDQARRTRAAPAFARGGDARRKALSLRCGGGLSGEHRTRPGR